MDLRGCSQMHFIAVIRGGEVIKVPNISRGKRPKLMNIGEIYLSSDPKCHDSLAKYPPKVDRSLARPFEFDEVKTEVKTKCMEEENEFDFGAVTLKQLQDFCKSRKRKASLSVNLIAVKEEDKDLQCEVDEMDLKETLGSWKSKVLMKAKAKKGGIFKCGSGSPTTTDVDTSLKGTPADLDLPDIKPMSIKVEDAEHGNSLQARSSALSNVFGNLTIDTVKPVEHCCPDTTSGYLQSGYRDQYSHEHLVQPVSTEESTCAHNQVSYEHLDYAELQTPHISEYPIYEETIKADSSAVIGDQPLDFCGSEVRREEDTADAMACDEPTERVLSACDSFDIQMVNPHHSCRVQLPLDEITSEVHVPCMAPYSVCRNAEIMNPGEAIDSIDGNRDIEGLLKRDATKCNLVFKFDDALPSADVMASLDKDISTIGDKQLSILDVTIEEILASPMGPQSNCHDTEFIENGEATKYMDDNPCTEAKATRRDFKNSSALVQDKRSLPLVNSVKSLHNVTSAFENSQSSILDAISPLTCSHDIQPSNAIDQHIDSAASEGHYKKEVQQQPPERLFSARKTISPNSKERLHKAMTCAETQDDTQIIACREKLLFEKNSVDTFSRSNSTKARIILTSKRLEALRATEIRASRQTPQKGKNERKFSLFRGTVNGGHASPVSAHAASVCSSSRSCSQNSIAFSQQQMIDIERIAMKLLTELQSMKEMVVDTLHSESRTSATSRYSRDKAAVAVENVKKVEETTKRWLSMMARDYNRFCKIMELSETERASPEKSNDEHILDSEICLNNPNAETKLDDLKRSPPKERKIMFADEAGESLCHVRVL